MDKKPEAHGAPRKGKEPKLEDKEQSERFIQTARELESDESGRAFSEAIRHVLLKKRKRSSEN